MSNILSSKITPPYCACVCVRQNKMSDSPPFHLDCVATRQNLSAKYERNVSPVGLTTFFFSLKGQCHKIFDHYFCLKYSIWASYEQGKTVSRRYSIAKFQNRVSLTTTPTPKFSLDTNGFIFLNYCYWVCKHTYKPFFT